MPTESPGWEIVHIVYYEPDRFWKVVVSRGESSKIVILYSPPTLGNKITLYKKK